MRGRSLVATAKDTLISSPIRTVRLRTSTSSFRLLDTRFSSCYFECMRYIVKPIKTIKARRAVTTWFVIDSENNKMVERHKTESTAISACKRLNGICLHCDKPLAQCKIDNPRDPDFGAEEDSDEGVYTAWEVLSG